MRRKEFEALVREIGLSPVPPKFRGKLKNVAFIIEDEPSEEVRREEGLEAGETLLGLYRGVPQTARGDGYGLGETLPDAITLYQKPIEEAADGDSERVKQEIKETIWHEVAHHFGLDHGDMEGRKHSHE